MKYKKSLAKSDMFMIVHVYISIHFSGESSETDPSPSRPRKSSGKHAGTSGGMASWAQLMSRQL